MRNTTRIRDLTGQKFNMLTAIRIAKRNPVRWECVCDCGGTCIVSRNNLTRGLQKSCGCLSHIGNPTHQHSQTRVYRIYAKIKRRCFIKDDVAYPSYGGRGITMCDEWKNSFMAFYEWAYSNGYRDDLSIDRIDNDKGYSPDNCRWADRYCQANNTRKNTYYTYNGRTQTMSEWAREAGIKSGTLWYRLKKGYPFEVAITMPVGQKGEQWKDYIKSKEV